MGEKRRITFSSYKSKNKVNHIQSFLNCESPLYAQLIPKVVIVAGTPITGNVINSKLSSIPLTTDAGKLLQIFVHLQTRKNLHICN